MNSNQHRVRAAIAVLLPLLVLTVAPARMALGQNGGRTQAPAVSRIPVVFSAGYDTDPRDRGRPVVLIAAALGVPSDVFRSAFRGVRPAAGGRAPEPGQVHENKAVLLGALGRYGVTNERLDRVSDYYRYPPGRGQMWRHRAAAGYATVRDGAITGFTLTDAGSGYTSAPTVTVPGFERVAVRATVAYGTDMERNGSVSGLSLAGR